MMRMSNRRFTQMTNAFSKKWRNHELMIAIHAVHYNYVRLHKTLRCTPAMSAALSATLCGKYADSLLEKVFSAAAEKKEFGCGSAALWSLEDMIKMADSYTPKPGKRGPYGTFCGLTCFLPVTKFILCKMLNWRPVR
jgi:hypothetical protein